ncbi:membrane protein [Catellatospora sp. TT07R-123]|nr:membrane protein [Catellatospora sp. TT07R-123]
MRRTPPPAALALIIAAAVMALQSLLLPLFAAPAANLGPRDLPVVVTGPAPAVAAFTARITAADPDAFEVTEVADAAAADAAVRGREAYAAFVLGPQGAQLHVASAAAPAVASLLTVAAQQLGAGGPPVAVTDLAPLPADDPHGGGFASGFFPLVITSILAAVALFFAVPRFGARIAGLLAFAALSGTIGATVLQGWLGVVGGEWLPVAGVIALITLAISATVNGLASVAGPRGIGLGAALVLLVGNALGAVGAAPELLPQPWGQFGQWLPIGAGATLLRSVAWFDGAGGTPAVWVLSAWAAVGLALVGLGWLGRKEDAPQDAPGAEAHEAARRLGATVAG